MGSPPVASGLFFGVGESSPIPPPSPHAKAWGIPHKPFEAFFHENAGKQTASVISLSFLCIFKPDRIIDNL